MLSQFLVLAAMAAAPLGAGAGAMSTDPAQPPAASRPAVEGRKVAESVRKIIAANYVLPDVRPRLDAALANGIASGRYDLSDPHELEARLNQDMGSVAHDKHLGLRFDPGEWARLAALPPGSGDDDAPPSPEMIAMASRLNFGFDEMKVLPENIRYVDLKGFIWADKATADVYDHAMAFLSRGDAAIIDLRGNGGGDPRAVRYLISHFVPAGKPLATFYMNGKAPETVTSLADVPNRMVGKPLYVLTGPMTASAAEEFAGHVTGYRLGETVGETTAGAGFRNSFFPVDGGFVISVSTGRAVLASTGKDWEGVGIAPSAKISPDAALDLAQARALRQLAQRADPQRKGILEATAALLDAKARPTPPGHALEAYVGRFGDRTVRVEDGALTYQRGMKVRLVPLGQDRFGLIEDPTTRIVFTIKGDKAAALTVIRGDGSRVEAPRDS